MLAKQHGSWMSGLEAFPASNWDDECYDYSLHQDAVQGCWCTLSSIWWHQAPQNCCNGREQHERSYLWICAASCSMCFASTCELVSFFNDPVNLLDLRLIRFHDNHIEIQPAACPMLCACKKEQSANMRQHPGKEIFLKGCSERDRHVTSNFEAWDLREPLAQQFQIDTALASCSRVFAFFQLRCPGCRKDPQGKPTRMVMPSFPVHVHGPTEYWKQRSYMAGLNSATHSRVVH